MKYLILASMIWCMAGTAPGAETVKASTFGFQVENATECLRKAIDSGAKTVVLDNTGSDWIIDQVKLRSDLELVIADGVTVRALPGAFKEKGDCLFSAWDARNLTLRGEGKARLVMNKKDYQNAAEYKWSEWRHLISLRGCENVTISNLTLESSGGDGIYVSTSSKMPGCRNVLIENITALDHHRQGISVISVDKLVIRNSKFNNTSGTPPAAGIDFEPNKPNEWISDCLVENCEFNNNAGAGVLFHLSPLNASSKPVSATVRNCMAGGNTTGVIVTASETMPVRGEITFENCRVTNSAYSAFVLNNQQENGLKITLKDCLLDNAGGNGSPVIISSKLPSDVANISFDHLTVIPGKNQPVTFLGLSGGGIKELSGTVEICDASGKKSAFNLPRFVAAHKPDPVLKSFQVRNVNLKALKPIGAKPGKGWPTNRFRGRFKLLQYAGAGRPVEMKFRVYPVGGSPLNVQVSVKDANGTPVGNFVISEPQYSYSLRANTSGVYVFEFNTGAHTVAVDYAAPGQAIWADSRTGMFRCSGQKFYFMVPAGVKDISIEVVPEINEPVSSALIAPGGKVVASFERGGEIQHLTHTRADASKDEIWSLAFPWSREDFRFRMGAPLAPLFSVSPESILTEQPATNAL